MPRSDSESNVSGYIRNNDNTTYQMYDSMTQKIALLKEDLQKIENNLQNILRQAGPMESQLSALFQTLPMLPTEQSMDTN